LIRSKTKPNANKIKPKIKKLVIHGEESTIEPIIIEPVTEIEKIKPTRGRPKKLKIVL
jgi:hypothetical protein